MHPGRMSTHVTSPPARSETRATTAAGSPRFRIEYALLAAVVACLALVPIEWNRVFGLPAHPLLVHVPVMLIPIVVIWAIVAMARPGLIRRSGVALAAVTVVALASTVVAAGAGEKFRDSAFSGERDTAAVSHKPPAQPAGEQREQQLINDHASSAETLRMIMFIFAAALVLAVLAERSRGFGLAGGGVSGFLARQPTSLGLRGAVVVLAVLAGFFVVRTGHLGAKATWQDKSGGGSDGDRSAVVRVLGA